MAKILIGLVAVIACFYLVESLECNKCSISLFGFCLSSSSETCSTNSSVCYTSRITFPSASNFFNGFSQQGCTESTNCANTNGTTSTSSNSISAGVFSVAYNVATTCCSTDKCNTVDLSGGAVANSMSLTMALSVAAMAAVWGTNM